MNSIESIITDHPATMMQLEDILSSTACDQQEPEKVLEVILPYQHQQYSFETIRDRLLSVSSDVELLQRDMNDKFEAILDYEARERLQNLFRTLHSVQLDVMKIQCDIAFTKEQCAVVNATSNDPTIQKVNELANRERSLRNSLQRSKFKVIQDFFEKLAEYLKVSLAASRRSCQMLVNSYLHPFDWAYYQQAILLLRFCGKCVIHIKKFERLYNSNFEIVCMHFKQPIEQMDFNNFIQFQESYPIESQLEVVIPPNEKLDLKDLLAKPHLKEIVECHDSREPEVFGSAYSQLSAITIDCCKLVVDLNMSYIEAHLTDGINIDKLNGESLNITNLEEQHQLPLYAFAPQEYITQIGQHLLTLRKQTESIDDGADESLRFALNSLQHAQDIALDLESCESVTEIIMKCIARHCVRSLLGRTSKSVLSKLTLNGKRQLSTDALYLDNVLEDLGLLDASEPNVEKFKSLLA